MNRVELATVIRFHLHELGAKNAAHNFEELCRHLSIMRIASNVVRATGPVGSGGDQGRDFETFRTYLAGTDIGGSTFVGRASGKNLAFACTLQQEGLKAKIKADIAKITGGGVPVEVAYAFTEANMPVADRHELQEDARNSRNVHLEVFDGQWIAEQLATPETFWIAEQFLQLPAEVYLDELQDKPETWYEELRGRWRDRTITAGLFGEYTELRRGVRFATDDAQADLPFWIGKLEELILKSTLSTIRRKAFYEIAVATLRGLGSLSGLEARLAAYFEEAMTEVEAASLEDAQVLLMYVSGAHQRGLVNLTGEQIADWRSRLDVHISAVADAAPNPSVKANLLQSLAAVKLVQSPPDVGKLPEETRHAVFDTLKAVLASAAEGFMFPIDRFAEWVDLVTPSLVDEPGYRDFADELDRLVIERTGRANAAEHRRDRAMALFNTGRLTAALREMHQTRIDWFAGDTKRGSLLAMSMIAHIYDRLHLPMAAKYYALAAAHLAMNLGDDRLLEFLPRGLLMAADADYRQGALMSFIELADQALHMRYQIQGKHPADIEEAQQVTLGLIVVKKFAKFHDSELDVDLAERLRRLNVFAEIQSVVDESKNDESYTSKEAFSKLFAEQMGAVPFSDTGEQRLISWRALGITWYVRLPNDYETNRAAERFCALAQVLLAEFADVELALLPTDVSIEIQTATNAGSSAEEIPSNDGRSWKITIPLQQKDAVEASIYETVAAVTVVLLEVSLLPLDQANQLIEDAFKAGLPGKLTPNTTYDRVFGEFFPPEKFDLSMRAHRSPATASLPTPLEHPELAWRSSRGPTYSADKAKEYVENRYRRSAEMIRLTLPRLVATPAGRHLIDELRTDGWLDWRILSALAGVGMNWRVNRESPTDSSEWRKLAMKYQQPEAADEPLVPLAQFSRSNVEMVDQTTMLSTTKVWDLDLRQRTPDFPAVRRFLNVRYRHDNDDIEHDDPFQPGSANGIVLPS